MRAFFQKSAYLLIFCSPFAAHATNLAAAPIPRLTLPWWAARWQLTLAQAQATPNTRVVWLGDSITQNWQRTGPGPANILPVWNQYYAPYQALDFGFKGDTTASLIWRLDHGQLAGLHPPLTIILIGANNFGLVHWGAAMTIPAIEAIVTNVHTRLPSTHILLLGVLPSIRSAWVDAQTTATNTALESFYTHNPTVTFVDAAPVLETNNHPDPRLYLDPPSAPALHPNATGMARIAALIDPIVRKYEE